jgi:spore coat protein U-like protein
MINYARWLLVTFITLFGFSPVFAATISASMGVSATVTPGCTALSTTNLNFGAVPAGNVTKDATSTITVTCAMSVAYNVTIDNGLFHPLFATQRKMGSGDSRLDYELYLDAAHTLRWHDGGFLSGTVRLDAIGNGGGQVNTVFGRVTSASNTPLGTYSDTVIVFLNF